MVKRGFDLLVSASALLVLWPLLLVLGLLVRLDSPGPALFRQERIGRFGRPFRILKFRTMRSGAGPAGPLITAAGDGRITRIGHSLRATKLDELPQLINVLKGDMSLVGPRPEVAKYVAMYPPADRELVLSVRPGITDEAAVEFRDEGAVLASADDPERLYAEEILPRKLALYGKYVRERSFAGDLRLLWRTVRAVLMAPATRSR
jgi:lipopolysaccharide/colanic/teichoic acid biosynthesis glycosyltransferase